MSWFDSAGLASFAKSALKEAQKQIDKALDIQEDERAISGSTSKTEPSTPARPPVSTIPTSASNVWGSFTGSFFDADPGTAGTVTTPPSAGAAAAKTTTDCSSESVDLVTSPSLSSVNNSPLRSGTSTVLNSESIEVLGAVAEPRSENSSFMVVASSASSTPASEFSDNGEIKGGRGHEEESSSIPSNAGFSAAGLEHEDDDEEEEENTVSESLAVTVMEPRAGGISGQTKEIVTIAPSSRHSLHLPLTSTTSSNLTKSLSTDMDGSSSSDQTLINQNQSSPTTMNASQKSNAAVLNVSLENYELQTEFSDSTHSFEEVHAQPQTNTSSGDELETATSSDIEIISNPNGCETSSTQSRLSPNKEGNNNTPAVIGGSFKNHRGHSRELSAASSQCSDELSDMDRMHKRIIELTEQLEKREYKLMEVIKQNAELTMKIEEKDGASTTAIHASSSSQPTSTAASQSVETVTAEFTHRLSALEKKFQHAIRERDQLRDQVKAFNSRIPKEVHEAALQEKDQLARELQQEGEKLSKQVLQHSNIIKKLRVKEKETDEAMKRQKDELREQGDEMERLKKSLAAKEDVERSQIEAVNRLASQKIILDSENGDLKGKLEDLQQKFDALQVSFNATKQELVDQKRKTEDLKSRSENLETQCADNREDKMKGDQLEKEAMELREKLRQLEMATQAREQTLRRENGELMRRVEESEMRNEELNQQVAIATVPLLKQMESLQVTLNSRTTNWERQERELVDALKRAEEKLKSLVDIEKTSEERETSLREEIQGLEAKIAGLMLKVEQAAMQQQHKEIELQLRVAEVERVAGRGKEEQKREMEDKVQQLEERLKEKGDTVEELQQEVERMRIMVVTAARGKSLALETSQQQMRFEREEFGGDDLDCGGTVGGGSGSPHQPLSREHSLDGSLTSNQWPLDDIDTMSNHGRPSIGSFYGGGSGGGGMGLGGLGGLIGGHTSTLENLQSNLKQRDGEVYHLNWEMNRLQTQRNTLANEISEMSNQMEELSAKCAQHDVIVEQFKDVQKKYDAMLQLYGEKVEEAEELKLDLQEAREAYKTQINELSFKLENPGRPSLDG